MLTYDVVVPVYDRYDMTIQMLTCIKNSTVQPTNIFMFDNGSTDETPTLVDKFSMLPIRYHRSETNLGVNPAWNYCMNLVESDYVAILNNDILFADYTIEMVLTVLHDLSQVGICIPHEVKDKRELLNTKPRIPIVSERGGRVPGFHYFIRRDLWLSIGPISDNVLVWYGDDHIWNGSKSLGYLNVECLNAPLFHYGHATLSSHSDARELLNGDHGRGRNRGISELFEPYRPFYKESIGKAKQPVVFLELGLGEAQSAKMFLEVINKFDYKAAFVDTNIRCKAEELGDVDRISIIKGSFKDKHVLDIFEEITLLHVDVDPHSYTDTKEILSLYLPKMVNGGIILFHDASPRKFGVNQALVESGQEVTFCPESGRFPEAAPAMLIKR